MEKGEQDLLERTSHAHSGILSTARKISSEEAMHYLSQGPRMGVTSVLKIDNVRSPRPINKLFPSTLTCFLNLKKLQGAKCLTTSDRHVEAAELLATSFEKWEIRHTRISEN